MPNRLAHETSPYLLQHKDNPVDWFPWGPEALEQARSSKMPILLSVGYSACHWCHVMEHESFSDPAVAALMNQSFVCIKVDREERPDLDDLYMRAVQAFSGGHGGWPMTVFLTPDGEPFFGGTYFPPTPRGGMPSFRQAMAHAQRTWSEIRAGKNDIHARVVQALREDEDFGTAPGIRPDWLDRVAAAAEDSFDPRHAGFGGAPKFPPHGTLSVLLAHHAASGRTRSLRLVVSTLEAMARGGLWDHLGGGFARYSVDAEWRVPHFEKMLYDNAQLVPLYVDAWRRTGDAFHARIARETLDYLLGDMRSPDGTFYASEDADSEGVEGRFYVWTPAQLTRALGADDGMRAARLLCVTAKGNFEHGKSVLRLEEPLERLDPADAAFLREVAFPALTLARSRRVRPGRDEKIVVSWNGLAIRAFAHAGAALDEPRYVEAAARAAERILAIADVDGRLHRIMTGGKPSIPAFLDDHANLLNGVLALWEATWAPRWLDVAKDLAARILDLFDDPQGDALFYTGKDAETLVARGKKLLGSAEPSGNGAAVLALTHLASLTADVELGARADRILRVYEPLLSRAPRALGEEAIAGAWRDRGGMEIGLVGKADDPALRALVREIRRRVLPFAVTARVDPGTDGGLPWMAGRPALGGKPTAYVCEGFACKLPVQEPAELVEQLEAATTPPPPRKAHLIRAPEWTTSPDAWLNTDRPLSLQQLRGHVVVLDFWTFCCINCMHVLPELAAVEAHFADQPVAVLGVHSAKFDHEKVREEVEAAIGRYRIRHPVILDPEHELWSEYAVRSWPTVVVVDSHGRIAWQKGGEVDRETLIGVVQALLDDARDDNTLAPRSRWSRAPLASSVAELHNPGKVLVHPSPREQAEGRLAFGKGARLFIADTGHDRILECSLNRERGWPVADVERVFGSGEATLRDGIGEAAAFCAPQGMSVMDGQLWVADTGNHAIRRIDLASGEVFTEAGTGALGRGDVQPGHPRETSLRSPWDVEAIDGLVFIAMAGSHQIWLLMTEQDRLGPFIGSGREAHVDGPPAEAALAQPSALCVWGTLLLFVDSETSSVRAYDFEKREVGTIVGQGLFDFGDVDGPPDTALLQHPLGLTVRGPTRNVAHSYNHKIKRITMPGGSVETLMGGEGMLSEPGGLDSAGDFLIVADTSAHRIVSVHVHTGEVRDLEVRGA